MRETGIGRENSLASRQAVFESRIATPNKTEPLCAQIRLGTQVS